MQQNIFLLHCPEYGTFLIQIRNTHRRRNLLLQLLPFWIGQFSQVLQIQVTPSHDQVIAGNAESLTDEGKEIVRHCPVVHKTAQGTDLPFLHFLPNAFNDITFLIFQINIGITGYLDTVTTVNYISGEDIRQVRTNNIIDKHDVELPFVLRQLYKARYLGIGYLHQCIMIFRRLISFQFPLAFLYHADHQIQTAVTDKGTDIPRLYHDRRQERKHLLIKEVMNELFMEWLRFASLIEIDILPVQLR